MQEILFPILTGLSLVFAGILIGYYLWFRDRTEQIELCEQLSADNESLASRLSAKASGVVELEDQNERIKARNEQLQQLCDDLMLSREKSDARSRDLETELYDARCKLDQSREQLTAECRLRAKSEESLHLAKQQYLDSVASMEKEWNHKVAESRSMASRSDNEVSRLTSLYEQTAEKLHESTATVAELKSELNSQRQMLDVAKNNAVGLEKEYVSLESSMRSQIELLNEARGQTAAAQSAQKLAELALAESRDEAVKLKVDSQKLQELHVHVNSVELQKSSLEQALANERERVSVLGSERDGLLSRCEELDAATAGINKRSENQQQTIRDLRGKLQNLEEQQVANLKTIEELTTQLGAAEVGGAGHLRTIESLRMELAKIETERNSNWEMLESLRAEFALTETQRFETHEKNLGLISRIDAVESDRREQLATMQALRQDLDQLEVERLELQETVVKLQSELEKMEVHRDEQARKIASLLDQIEVAGTGRSELEESLETMRAEFAQVEANRRDLQETVDSLRQRIRDAEAGESELRTECVTLTQRIADLEKLRLSDENSLKTVSEENARLLLRVAELDNSEVIEAMAHEATARFNSVVKQRDNAMEQVQILSVEVADLKAEIEVLKTKNDYVDFPRLHAAEDDSPERFAKEYGGRTRMDSVRGVVFTERPDQIDDLKRIYGVAEVLEKKLNDYGIYTFKQIMNWDDRAIVEFSELLIFKDRIHRDDWRLQKNCMKKNTIVGLLSRSS